LFSSFCVLDAAFHPEHRVKILLAPENSAADESLLPRIVELEKNSRLSSLNAVLSSPGL
jgi:hypothetical protein